jgi:hypothetical protein
LRASNHLRRRAPEPIDQILSSYYRRLLACLRRPEVRDGDWTLLEARPAWEGNTAWERFIAFSWDGGGRRLLAAVNYGPTQGQCYVRLPYADLSGRKLQLRDLMNPTTVYDRQGDELAGRGLYVDMPAWGYHLFEITARG